MIRQGVRSRRERPCPICGNQGGWCLLLDDGAVWCGHVLDAGAPAPAGWKIIESPATGRRVLRPEGDERPKIDEELVAQREALARKLDAVKIQRARVRWNDARSQADDDVAIGYLARRGIDVARLPAFDDESGPGLPPVICGVREWDDEYLDEETGSWVSMGTWPALVAAFVDADLEIVALQQIFLDRDDPTTKRADLTRAGSPRPAKKQLGVMRGGGAVRLSVANMATLALCEGLETGMAVAQAMQMPVWCCLSTGGLHRPGLDTLVGETVKRIVFFGDYDNVNAMTGERPGERAARHAAGMLSRAHESLTIDLALPSCDVCPTLIGTDGEIL